ncbi:hypothetical protein [Methylobacterium symbioticum]|uniref:Uncharacterized protein n=1 Tax=Methylobacterium symbioticum TaxID=2584084 RepID=A0A509E8V6_9HYPH|nr:hypothetical protein [Methylobacterium symbioticum]VUD70035.1 hypothetical protein MET9862_00596 [Methylobacterium symbioticum]
MSLSKSTMLAALRLYAKEPPRRSATFDPPARKPVTLPPITLHEITDDDVGLPDSPVDQARAEAYLLAVRGRQAHLEMEQAQRARLAAAATRPTVSVEQKPAPAIALVEKSAPAVHVSVPDDTVVLIDPTDTLTELEQEICAQFRRLTEQPRSRWLA